MALAVVEANRLDAREGLERMSEADGKSCPPENSTRAPVSLFIAKPPCERKTLLLKL